jgi:endonuclease/exonuclease/phosphatase family metal-dependent hydrolase
MVKIATINILYKLEEWEQRRTLLVDGLKGQQADLIALQEVKLPEDTSAFLASELNMPYVYLVPFQSSSYKKTNSIGIAILSRYPFIIQGMVDLQSQGRRMQYVQVEVDGQPLVLCNGHYYWYPGSHQERVKQIELLLNWKNTLPVDMPIVAVGDFNGTPETSAIMLMKQHFTSAYYAYHNQEPEYTCPTLLARRDWKKVLSQAVLDLIFNQTLKPWRGTLDYIFINEKLRVINCFLILNQPALGDPTLYPSDHFGIAAELQYNHPLHPHKVQIQSL